MGRKALPKGWEWSVDSLKVPGVVGRPSQRAGSDWEALPKGRGWSETLREGQKALPEGREAL